MFHLAAAIGAIGTGSALCSCLLRPRGVVSFVLAAYLVAWAAVVALSVLLSTGDSLRRGTLTLAALGFGVLALGAWLLSGRPRPPPFGAAARHARDALADPLVLLPVAISIVTLGYTLVVTLTTAANDGDPLVYEVTRAMFWRQEHGLEALDAAYEPRLDFSPPVAETGVLATLTLGDTDRFVGLPQWLAVTMLALAVYGVARRVGLGRRPAVWSAALVPTLPVVATQSWSAYTDVVFGSFFVAAVYFGIGHLGLELVAFALAVGLAAGTKLLGPIYVPLLATILAVAQPARRWPPLAASGLAGLAIAGAWYLRNLLEASDPAGNSGVGLQSRELAPVATTFARHTLELFDLSGASGRNIWLYGAAAVLVAALGLGRVLGGDRGGRMLLVAAAAIALAPFVVELVARGWAEVGVALGEGLGRADLVDQIRHWRAPTVSDGAYSWFGPLGAAVSVGAFAVAALEVRRRRLEPVALVLGAGPLLALALLSVVIAYERFHGRYVIAPVVLALAVCGGFALRHRWVGASVVAVAGVTAVLSLANALGKPSGVSLVGEAAGRSVWSMPRWMQQGILRSTPAERDEVRTIEFVEERVPPDASVGIALVGNSFAAPYFGPRMDRRVVIVDTGDTLPRDVDWVVVAAGRAVTGCPSAWSRVRAGPYGWSVWRRRAPDDCSRVERLPS